MNDHIPTRPFIAKVQLGRLLKRYRERAGMSAGEVTRRMSLSESKLRKLERGANEAVRWQDILGFGVVYEVSSDESQNLLALAEASNKPGWRDSYEVLADFVMFLEMENCCSTFRTYEPELVNGLFQTEAYMQALAAAWSDGPGKPMNVRMTRQQTFFARDPLPNITYIMNEAVMKRQVGGRRIIKEQVQHLVAFADRPNISILVLPFKSGAHRSMAGGYTIMDFDGATVGGIFPQTVYIDSGGGALYEERAKVVANYEAMFAQSMSHAVPIKEFLR